MSRDSQENQEKGTKMMMMMVCHSPLYLVEEESCPVCLNE